MPRLGVLIPTFRRPRKLARVLTSLLCQSTGDFKVYIGIQDADDLEAPEVVNVTYALRGSGIAMEVVEVPLDRGRFVATKNALLARVQEEYAFHTDDDFVFEANYLETLLNCLDERHDIDCVSGKIVLTDEIPIDQWGAPELPYGGLYDFSTIDDEGMLHWAPKLQRVDYSPDHEIVKVRALMEQFMFRTEVFCDPLDDYFDQDIFYLNETEWTHREFRCGFTPAVKAYHVRDGKGLSLNRETSFASMNRAARYFAKKTFGVDIKGVVWKPKFWLRLGWSTPHVKVNLIAPSYSALVSKATASEILELIAAEDSGLAVSKEQRQVTRVVASGGFLLARCEGRNWQRESLLEVRGNRLVLVANGRISWGRTCCFAPHDRDFSS